MTDTPKQDKRDQSIRRILDAALKIFATLGFNGARIDDIAREAGINKAMIYYRIGDKQTLYQAVIHDIYSDRTESLKEKVLSEPSPEKKLNTFIADVAATLSDHPYFTKIMMREIITGWTNFSQAVIEDVSGTFKVLRTILDEGIKKGVFIQADPLAVHHMTMGTLLLHNLSLPVRNQFQAVLGTSGLSPDNQSFNNLVPEVQRLMLAALRP